MLQTQRLGTLISTAENLLEYNKISEIQMKKRSKLLRNSRKTVSILLFFFLSSHLSTKTKTRWKK
jgi:hypothetical protein